MGSRAGNRPWLWRWPSLRMMELETESGSACSTHHRGTTMEYYAGIDVSLESASLCVVDATGRIVRQGGQRARDPDRMVPWPGARGDADRAGGRTAVAVAVRGH